MPELPVNQQKCTPLQERYLTAVVEDWIETLVDVPGGLMHAYAAYKTSPDQGDWIYNSVIYKSSKKEVRTGDGRVYARPFSLQGIPMKMKNLLIGGDEHHCDLDLKNCVPTITLYMCQRAGHAVPMLAEYVNDRHRVLGLLSQGVRFKPKTPKDAPTWGFVKKDEVYTPKDLILALLHGGSASARVQSCSGEAKIWLEAFENEVKLMWRAYPKNQFESQWARLRPDLASNNAKGKYLAACNFDIESRMLLAAERAISGDVVVRVRSFDGLLIDRPANIAEIIAKMNAAVEAAFPGANMEFVDKSAGLACADGMHNFELLKPNENKSDAKAKKERAIELEGLVGLYSRLAVVFPAPSPAFNDTCLAGLSMAAIQDMFASVKKLYIALGKGKRREGAVAALCSTLLGHSGKYKFCKTSGAWFACDEETGLWQQSSISNQERCHALVQAIRHDVPMALHWLALNLPQVGGGVLPWANEALMSFYDLIANETCKRTKIQESLASHPTFAERNFTALVDNPDTCGHLLSFTNGYIDLNTVIPGQEPVLHVQKQSNYVTMTTGYDFEWATDEEIRTARATLRELFLLEDDEKFAHLLQGIASSLSAHNLHEAFMMWIGSGGNGKGVLDAAVKAVFGPEYSGDLDVPAIAQSADPCGKPQPALCAAHKKRFVMIQEAGNKKKVDIDEARVNQLTGGDALSIRDMYGKTARQSTRPQYTLFASLNDPWESSGAASNKALQRRKRRIDFPLSFKYPEDIDKTNPRHRRRDDSVKATVTSKAFRRGFLRLLLETYSKMYNTKEEPYHVPKCVLEATAREHLDNDPFLEVFNSLLDKADDEFCVVLDDVAHSITERLRNDHRRFESKAEVKRRIKRDYNVQPKFRLQVSEGKMQQITVLRGYKMARGVYGNTYKGTKVLPVEEMEHEPAPEPAPELAAGKRNRDDDVGDADGGAKRVKLTMRCADGSVVPINFR